MKIYYKTMSTISISIMFLLVAIPSFVAGYKFKRVFDDKKVLYNVTEEDLDLVFISYWEKGRLYGRQYASLIQDQSNLDLAFRIANREIKKEFPKREN